MERKVVKISIGQILLVLIIVGLVTYGIAYFSDKNKDTEDVEKSVSSAENILNKAEEIIETEIEIEDDTIFSDGASIIEGLNSFMVDEEEAEITDTLDENEIFFVTAAINNNDGTYTLNGCMYNKYTATMSEIKYAVSRGYITIYGTQYSIKEADVEGEYSVIDDTLNYELFRFKLLDPTTYYLELQSEISSTWKLREELRTVTVAGDTECEMVSGEILTVADVFTGMENMEAEEKVCPNTARTFTFEFTNGECSKVVDVQTSF